MERFKAFWDKLPKSLKVFIYIAVSTLLSELLIEFREMEQTLVVRYLAQIFNLVIVMLQEYVPPVANKLRR